MERFICVLANSIKFGGRCIAGKEVFTTNRPGHWTITNTWLRPLGSASRGELHAGEFLSGGRNPGPLDIVEIPFSQPKLIVGQPEDWSITPGRPWKYHGTFKSSVISQLVDNPANLWLEPFKQPDRVSTAYLVANALPSLQLVHVSNLHLFLEPSTDFNTGQPRLKRRCRFKYRNVNYDLALTDPAMQERFFPTFPNCPNGLVNPGPSNDSVICVSLSPALSGMHYKLVAAIL